MLPNLYDNYSSDIDIYEDVDEDICPVCGGEDVGCVDVVYWGGYWPSTYDTPEEYNHWGWVCYCGDCRKHYVIER